ncbi:MAG: cytosine permease [Lachnospiraceae bacterium]|nr:cytosine permease [Lachnospiraceae bacterium]
MSGEEKKELEAESSELEYAFESVPDSAKKSLGSILVILTGYTISLSNFVSGATVGSKMPFKEAVAACALGNIMLIIVATLLGIIAFRTGLSTSVLARKALGARSSAILSFLLVISAVNWIAVNADTFSNLIKSTFGWWPIPVAITSILVVAIWAQSAIRGVKGLEIVSWLGVPCALVLTIVCAIAISVKTGYSTVFNFIPASDVQISFASGSTSFVGAWIFGCIVSPDVCRYAKKRNHVAFGAPIAVAVGLFGLEVIGIMTAQATNQSSFVEATAALGLGVLVFICAIFCVWTTQDNNIYSAGLALQNVMKDTPLEGKVKHAVLAVIIATAAAIFAAAGATKYLLPVVQTLSILLPPIPGLIIAEFYFVKKSKENKAINWVAIITWIIGTAVGYVALQNNFLIPAIVSMIVTFVLYIVLSKCLDGVVNKDL